MASPADHGATAVQGLGPASAFDERVYGAITKYAFDEPECFPSQHLIAHDLGCSRESVNRAVRRLIRAGWLRIKEKRWGGRGWLHNVYELFAPYAVSPLTARRIVRRAHRRARRALRAARGPSVGADHTNPKGGRCGCPSCRPDRPRTGDGPGFGRRGPPTFQVVLAASRQKERDEIQAARAARAARLEDALADELEAMGW